MNVYLHQILLQSSNFTFIKILLYSYATKKTSCPAPTKCDWKEEEIHPSEFRIFYPIPLNYLVQTGFFEV